MEEAACGKVVTPEDYDAIHELMNEFIRKKDSEALKQMGENGRDYLARHLTKDVSIEKYKEEILSC